MKRPQSPSLAAEYTRQAVQKTLGTAKFGPLAALILAFLVTLNWFANASLSLTVAVLSFPFSGEWPALPAADYVGCAAFIAMAAVAWTYTRNALPALRFHVEAYLQPARARVLVLYLSPPTDEEVEELLALSGNIQDAGLRSVIKGRWRMPLEAIGYHLPKLQEVVVIPSATTVGTDAAPQAGTVGTVDDFARVVEHLTTEGGAPTLRVSAIGELLPEYVWGVDYDDLDGLVRATDRLVEQLISQYGDSGEVLIDVTSGTKLSTVAGAAVALAENRRFQYVSNSYELRVYDPTYREAS